jgi:hypothetical protein
MGKGEKNTDVLGSLLDNRRVYVSGLLWSLANAGWSLLLTHTEIFIVDYLFLLYLFVSLYSWLNWLPKKSAMKQRQPICRQQLATRTKARIDVWGNCRRHHWISARMG